MPNHSSLPVTVAGTVPIIALPSAVVLERVNIFQQLTIHLNDLDLWTVVYGVSDNSINTCSVQVRAEKSGLTRTSGFMQYQTYRVSHNKFQSLVGFTHLLQRLELSPLTFLKHELFRACWGTCRWEAVFESQESFGSFRAESDTIMCISNFSPSIFPPLRYQIKIYHWACSIRVLDENIANKPAVLFMLFTLLSAYGRKYDKCAADCFGLLGCFSQSRQRLSLPASLDLKSLDLNGDHFKN